MLNNATGADVDEFNLLSAQEAREQGGECAVFAVRCV